MRISDFRKARYTPTLIAAFLYFDVSFMAWVLLGPLGPFVAETYKLSATQKGFRVALPLLAGSFFRPILGVLGDVLGPRRNPRADRNAAPVVLGLALCVEPAQF